MTVYNHWYNEEIGNFIDQMPITTNVLEQYDNVVYNIGLYMLMVNDQEEIEKQIFENQFNDKNEVNFNSYKKIILAQSGVTSRFSINSLKLKTVFGINNNEPSIMTYSANIKLYESYGCNFANELGFATKYCGYESYFERPVWLEVWFSGYDQVSGKPIEKIPLPNGYDSILLQGHLASAKSDVTNLGTEWDIEFIPHYKALVNNTFNCLSVEGIIKNDGAMNLKDFMDKHVQNIFNKFIDTLPFPKDDTSSRNDVKKYYTSNDIIVNKNNMDNEDYKNFIKINYYERKNNNLGGYYELLGPGDFPELEQGFGAETDKNGASIYKTDMSMTFTSICQDFLHFSKNHKSYIAKYFIKTKLKGYFLGIPLFEHKIDIVLEKNDLIDYQLEESNNKHISIQKNELKKISTDMEFIKTNLFYQYINNGSLVKKYQFAFSGEDTSVIELSNKQEMLYYLPAIYYEQKINAQNAKNYYMNSENNVEKNDEIKIFSTKDIKEDIYLEDLYKYKEKNNNMYSTSIVQMNEVNDTSLMKNKSEETEKNKNVTDAQILYKRYFKSGSISNVKMTIYGDPYWISMNAVNFNPQKNNKNILNADFNSLEKLSNNFRFVFLLKTCPDQTNGLEKFDYDFENSIYISGIYSAVECESEFDAGKFTQTLSGVLDPSLLKNSLLEP